MKIRLNYTPHSISRHMVNSVVFSLVRLMFFEQFLLSKRGMDSFGLYLSKAFRQLPAGKNIEFEIWILSWLSNNYVLRTDNRIFIHEYLRGQRWPEVETILLLRAHPVECYSYVIGVMKCEWEEAEPIIKKNRRLWMDYEHEFEL